MGEARCSGQGRLVVLAIVMAALGGCDGPKPAPDVVPMLAPPPPSPPALGRPGAPTPALGRPGAPAPTQTLHSSTNEKTRVAADGSVHTTRTTTSVTFNPTQAAAALGPSAAAPSSAVNVGIPGIWRATSSSTGTGCTLSLHGDPAAVAGAASAACRDSASMLSGSTAWRYADGKLTVMKGSEVAMVFHRAGANHYAGTAKWGFLTTTIRLTR